MGTKSDASVEWQKTIGKKSRGRPWRQATPSPDLVEFPTNGAASTATAARPKMKTKHYERELATLQARLVAMQEWVVATGAGSSSYSRRDTAGKGNDQTDPRARQSARVQARRFACADRAGRIPNVHPALHAALSRRRGGSDLRSQLVQPSPTWSESWAFAPKTEARRFLELVPLVERTMVESEFSLIKYWLEVSADEQTRRLKSRIGDPSRPGSSPIWI